MRNKCLAIGQQASQYGTNDHIVVVAGLSQEGHTIATLLGYTEFKKLCRCFAFATSMALEPI